MKTFRVVADSSCLIGLAHLNLLESLQQIFLKTYLPSAVYTEVVVNGKGKTGSDEVASAVKAGWLIKTVVKDELAVDALLTNISRGEAEVIVLAKELNLDYALIDERRARNLAALMNVKTVGIFGILDLAILTGIPVQKKAAVDRLQTVGFRISERLYRKILKKDEHA